MRKKQTDQNGAPGIIVTASGYAMNAKPGPTTSRQTGVKLLLLQLLQ